MYEAICAVPYAFSSTCARLGFLPWRSVTAQDYLHVISLRLKLRSLLVDLLGAGGIDAISFILFGLFAPYGAMYWRAGPL